MEIKSIFDKMRKDQAILQQKADLYIRYMLNGRHKYCYKVSINGPDTIRIDYRNATRKKCHHVVNQQKFIDKVNFYSRDKGIK